MEKPDNEFRKNLNREFFYTNMFTKIKIEANMNRQECDVLNTIKERGFFNQRQLAEESGHSLGIVNKSLKSLQEQGYLDDNLSITSKGYKDFEKKSPKRAIILAAGFGMRMVPINMEMPKALLEIKKEVLIEHQIKQLHEVGIKEIYIVVGFMKEKFEYLIDKYNVKLIVNSEYAVKNNLHSINKVKELLANSYVIPCDIWCDENPFKKHELYSWYMVGDVLTRKSDVRVNRNMELVRVNKEPGNIMYGIAYLVKEDAQGICKKVSQFCKDIRYDDSYWEETLYSNNKMSIYAKVVSSSNVQEINTYEQLRDVDINSKHLENEAINVIAKVFNVSKKEIKEITVLKKGMTNRSFLFQCKNNQYIMRIPGEGTEQLINRNNEKNVYQAISGKGFCDDPIYIDAKNGYKVTAFLNDVRVCDAQNKNDLKKCMKILRSFHDCKIKVKHDFDIFKQINFYESLWKGQPSVYDDHKTTTKNVFSLKAFIDKNTGEKCLTHIDAVPDNFLFYNRKGKEEVQLTDWEYAGMQDPHVDIAMFCIYSLYDRKQVDDLIDIYFENQCDDKTRIKIYCYIAACGLLWSNWCEYKRQLGIEFGEYSLRQYRYAKEYYKIAKDLIEKL